METIHEEPKLEIDSGKAAEVEKQYLQEIELHPKIYVPDKLLLLAPLPVVDDAIRRSESTMYEGNVLYLRYWNYWVRAGERADDRVNIFYPDFENPNPRIFSMIHDIGVTTAPSSGERHIWEKTADVWQWLGLHVTVNGPEYATISTHPAWPSIDDYAAYYQGHGNLVWTACFSKAHLFASILGRVGIPRWRITIAESHHTVGGAPSTATHVFVAVYVAERWFYLDPTWVSAVPKLPGFDGRVSVGLFKQVDYEHPYETIPVPLSGFDRVPLLHK
jgi:hypothetical protein